MNPLKSIHAVLASPVVLLALLLATPALADPSDPPFTPPPADASAADWAAFSENLVYGLRLDNDGLRASALQMIICYGERLDVRGAEFDVVKIYRSHPDARMRRLALVAIGHLGSSWAVGFLRMSDPFEPDSVLQATLRAVVADYEARQAQS